MRVDKSRLLNPGWLRHRVTWQSRALVSPNSGDDDYTWSDVVVMPARVEPIQGREMQVAEQLQAIAQYRITQHYRANLTREMRLSWNGQTLDVLDIQEPVGVPRVQVILAKDHVE